jgi:hypothetical protein
MIKKYIKMLLKALDYQKLINTMNKTLIEINRRDIYSNNHLVIFPFRNCFNRIYKTTH